MKLVDTLRKLHEALDDLHVAMCNATLDHTTQTHKDNAATVYNVMRWRLAYSEVQSLFEIAREDMATNPTAANVRSLRRADRRIPELLLNYLPAYLNDLGEDDDNTVH